jgi:hypothetical protein
MLVVIKGIRYGCHMGAGAVEGRDPFHQEQWVCNSLMRSGASGKCGVHLSTSTESLGPILPLWASQGTGSLKNLTLLLRKTIKEAL